MKNYSFFSRLQIIGAGMLLITLGTVGVVLEQVFSGTAQEAAVGRLQSQLYSVLAAAEVNDNQLLLSNQKLSRQFQHGQPMLNAVVLNTAGDVAWVSSPQSSLLAFAADHRNTLPARNEQRVMTTTDSVESLFVLCFGAALQTDAGLEDYVFIVAESKGHFEQVLADYRLKLWSWLTAAGLFLLFMQIFVMYWVVRPLRKIVNDLNDIQEERRESLDENYPRELKALIGSVNELLDNEAKQKEYYRNNLANLAHSLKTPLAVLRSAIFEKDLRNVRDELAVQVENLDQIVSYQLQRAILPGSKLMSKPVSLLVVAEKLCRTLDKVYSEKEVDILINIDPDEMFFGDEHDIFEIMGNLMENACKYTRSKVIVDSATTAMQRKKRQCCIIIEDNGSGIPPDEVDSALSRGVRLDSQSHGQGIGLAMVADLVEGYKGSINIEQSDMGGCRFIVVI